MKSNDLPMRRQMMCGFVPEDERIDGQRWIPDRMDRKEVPICPGYTTSLPEVFDAAQNYDHYDSGQLMDALHGRVPGTLWNAVAALRNSIRALDNYRSRETVRKMQEGGGHGPR